MGYALITGASGGIGFELAKIFAENGRNIIVVSSNENKLNAAAEKLRMTSKADVRQYVIDLCADRSADMLFELVSGDGLFVDVLVNNAGVGMTGEFLKLDPEKEEAMLSLNINSLVRLTRLFAAEMECGGKILNVSSTGAFQAGPYISVYYASKAFVSGFSEAIRHELRSRGVSVSTLYPGATKTDFSRRAGKKDAKKAMSAEFVALEAYRGMMKNKRRIIPGLPNKLMLLIPAGIRTSLIGRLQKSLVEEKANEQLS